MSSDETKVFVEDSQPLENLIMRLLGPPSDFFQRPLTASQKKCVPALEILKHGDQFGMIGLRESFKKIVDFKAVVSTIVNDLDLNAA